jgi:DNA-binding Xre family transcriptional regulator
MIRFAPADVLREKGKSVYWLHKETGVRNATLHRLATKPVEKIDLSVLEKIMKALECGSSDLLKLTE